MKILLECCNIFILHKSLICCFYYDEDWEGISIFSTKGEDEFINVGGMIYKGEENKSILHDPIRDKSELIVFGYRT